MKTPTDVQHHLSDKDQINWKNESLYTRVWVVLIYDNNYTLYHFINILQFCRCWRVGLTTLWYSKKRESPVKITTTVGMPKRASGSRLGPENTCVSRQPWTRDRNGNSCSVYTALVRWGRSSKCVCLSVCLSACLFVCSSLVLNPPKNSFTVFD